MKTTANRELQTLLPPLLGPSTLVCTLQNGLGNEDLLASLVGKDRVLCGVCHVCVSRPEPGVALNMSGGNIRFSDLTGGDTPRAHSLAQLFENAGLSCSVAPSVGSARWYKLVWNIPFNGLAIAEGGIDTAQITCQSGPVRQNHRPYGRSDGCLRRPRLSPRPSTSTKGDRTHPKDGSLPTIQSS